MELSSRVGSGDGTPDISPTAFLVDVCDKIYTSGWGSSAGGLGGQLTTTGLPVTPGAIQTTTTGHDLYLAIFDINMTALDYGTYFGGPVSPEHVDGGTSRFDRRGRVYQSVCAGCQGNSDFPTTPGAFSATNNSGCNLGVVKMDFDAPLVIANFTHVPAPPSRSPTSAVVPPDSFGPLVMATVALPQPPRTPTRHRAATWLHLLPSTRSAAMVQTPQRGGSWSPMQRRACRP